MSAEQSYSTLHFKFDLFHLQLKKRRRKQKHEHSQRIMKVILVKARWRITKKDAARCTTSSIPLFHNNIPALDFPQTKSLVKNWQNCIPETVYQMQINSAGWSWCDEKRWENTFNPENKNVLIKRPKDNNFFQYPSTLMQSIQY